MKAWLVSYVAAGVVFLAIDAIWLTVMTGAFYRPMLGELIAERPRLAPAAAFYLIYIAGVVTFAVSPALASGRWSTALFLGAALGLVAYATYDLTNQATLRNWPAAVTIVDLAWGATLTAASATAAYFIAELAMRIGRG
jgi:uncharacterized membrane protein